MNPGDALEGGDSDPSQALGFERAADWATEAAPHQPPTTAAAAESWMLDWRSITESTLAGWCADLLPPVEAGVVSVRCTASAPDTQTMQTILAALSRDGAVVLERAISPATCAAIIQELEPYHGTTQSRVIGGVAARSPAARDCALHPVVLALAEGVLGHQCLRPSGALSGADIVRANWPKKAARRASRSVASPGGGLAWRYGVDHTINAAPLNVDTSRGMVQAQLLHRDGHKWMCDLVPEIENELKMIVSLTEFTERTGATKIIRGSHHWPSVIALAPPPPDAAGAPKLLIPQFSPYFPDFFPFSPGLLAVSPGFLASRR